MGDVIQLLAPPAATSRGQEKPTPRRGPTKRTLTYQQVVDGTTPAWDEERIMAIPTEMSLTGYIATDPQLKYISENVARFYARIRVDYPRVNDDGTVSNRGPTYHDLIAFQTTAEHAYARFRRGDAFVASGSVTEYTLEHDGEPVHYEGFVARHVGHDATRTRYTVDRSPEHQQDRSSDRQMAVSTERTLEL